MYIRFRKEILCGRLLASKNQPRKLVSTPAFATINFYGIVCYQVGGFNQSETY